MNRYERQIALPEIGEEGQKRLKEAKVLIVGVGGLGSPIALYLSGAGIGRLGLVDDDVVSLTNLHRQILYSEKYLGELKASCASQRLHELNSEISIDVYPYRLAPENAKEIISKYDIVVDGCDNFRTRYLLNDTCMMLGKPYIYGAIGGFEGQVSVFGYGEHSCNYRNLHPEEEEMLLMPPPDKSVTGVTAGIVGCAEANEVLKLICGYGEPLAGKLWTIDLRTMQTHILSFD